ncbi:hypothetical protein [Mycobacterium sp. 236(2023)]|uniref:hypothetical protein n=1 Tax=Mycobacterium sp. 236(2023) TaxID=3038163 RepID=UPI00241582E8|nr:hypothetical protein [Mycobacterium sp. 236(2023)]MDG4667229.1 hypothetical protein [Mycobacterium sp. 236(2023)]
MNLRNFRARTVIAIAAPVAAGALSTAARVDTSSAAVALSQPISYAMSYTLTFDFANAGSISVDVPVVSPDADKSPTTLPVRPE